MNNAHRKPKRLEVSKTKYPRKQRTLQQKTTPQTKPKRPKQPTKKTSSLVTIVFVQRLSLDFRSFFEDVFVEIVPQCTLRRTLEKKERKYPTDEGQTDGQTHRISRNLSSDLNPILKYRILLTVQA